MPSLASMLARMSDLYGSPGVPLANRNLFIDGHFDFWQASPFAAPAGASYGGPVMWATGAGTGGVMTVSGVDLRTAVAATGLPFAAYMDAPAGNCMQCSLTTVGSGGPTILQRIENGATAAGRSLTFSIKAWCAAGTVQIPTILLRQNFGAGTNSPSGQVLADVNVNWTITTTPRRFSVRLDLPSVQGKVFGNQGGDNVVIGFFLPYSTTYTVAFAEAQLEYCNPKSSGDLTGNGGAPTAFEYRGIGVEQARADRFYQGNYTVWYGAQASAADQYRNWTFAFRSGMMRTTPAVTLGSLTGSSWGAVTPTVYGTTLSGFQVNANFANTTGSYAISGYSADARM